MSGDEAGVGLAAVVSTDRTAETIDVLRREGAYDDSRGIDAHDLEAGTVAVPVTAADGEGPESVEAVEGVERVIERALPSRRTDLADHLRARGWSDAEIDRAPGSWAVVGSVVLIEAGDYPRPDELGEALLALHGEADTVVERHGVTGETRDPDVRVLAGAGETETIHREHGTRYALDLAETTFSPGNKAERARMGEVVADGERVFDMFAGIGYFTLPMARAGAEAVAAEIDPVAYRYLVENAVLNGVEGGVEAYRADCRAVAPDLDPVDRVVMGYYDAHAYLDAALSALGPGGIVHLHEATPEPEVFDRPVGRLEAAATERERGIEVLDRRVVKSHAPGVEHVVIDARVE